MLTVVLILGALGLGLLLLAIWCAGAVAKDADARMDAFGDAPAARRALPRLCNPGDDEMQRQIDGLREQAVQMGAVA